HGPQQLGHLGRFEDLVDRDPAEGRGHGGLRRLGGVERHFRRIEVGVESVALNEVRASGLVAEELVGFAVALADAGDVAGQDLRFRVVLVEVCVQRGAVAGHPDAELFERGEVFNNLVDPRGVERMAVAQAGEGHILGTELEQDAVELLVIVDVLLALLALDFVERRLGDVDVALLDQAAHLPVEEREQQRADVRAVDVGVGHDDDLVVAGLVDVEAALALGVADAGAEGGDERADFLVGEYLVEAGLLDVDDFTAEREDRLVAAIAALLGGTAGGITLDDVEFAQRGIAFGAVGQLAGKAAAGERALADRLARLACGLARAGGVEGLVDDALGDLRRLFEDELQLLAHDL